VVVPKKRPVHRRRKAVMVNTPKPDVVVSEQVERLLRQALLKIQKIKS
jgi:hypothetical protein